MKTNTIGCLVLALGLGLTGLGGARSAAAGGMAIAQTDAEQIVRAAIVAKYPGVVIKQIKSSKSNSVDSVRRHSYTVLVLNGKTQMSGRVVLDMRAWSPRAGIDRVSEISLERTNTNS